jgi:hypothetical protein
LVFLACHNVLHCTGNQWRCKDFGKALRKVGRRVSLYAT